jgi:hypothetical protein
MTVTRPRAGDIFFIAGGIWVMLGAIAGVGLQTGGDLLALRLFPALFLHLRRPLIGGGDFPPDLSGIGIVAVYIVPGAVLLALGILWPERRTATGTDHDLGA